MDNEQVSNQETELTSAATDLDETTGTASVEQSTAQADVNAEANGDLSETTGDGTKEPAEDVYYDIEGEEVSLSDIKGWKSGQMKNTDYTQKTQKVAEESKAVKAERQALTDKISLLGDIENELSAVVMGDLAGVDMDQLMQTDPSEYLRVNKLREDKGKTLSNLAAKRDEIKKQLNADSYQALHTSMDWDDASKRDGDLKLITGFAKRDGTPEADFATFLHPSIMRAFAAAEKYHQLQDKKPEVAKRVLKGPKGTKPGAKSTSQPKSIASRLYGT